MMDEFHAIFVAVSTLCADIGVEIMPHITKRQTQQCNIIENSPEAYFRAAIFVPFLSVL